MSTDIICTICEKHYAYGLGALINSALKVGFDGRMIVAVKGKEELPFWCNQLIKTDDLNYRINEIHIEFILFEWDDHPSYYKPFLIKEIYSNNLDSTIFYMDPDITLVADWNFFKDWSQNGIALCVDQTFTLLGINHPWITRWESIFSLSLRNNKHNLIPYLNSGFFSIKLKEIAVIDCWIKLTHLLLAAGHDLKKFGVTKQYYQHTRRANPILTDQDILNAVLLANDEIDFSVVGQEAMGFINGGYIMMHNTGIKTWNKNFLKIFLKNGTKTGQIDESFFRNCESPIKLFSNYQLQLKKQNLKLTKILQRIF